MRVTTRFAVAQPATSHNVAAQNGPPQSAANAQILAMEKGFSMGLSTDSLLSLNYSLIVVVPLQPFIDLLLSKSASARVWGTTTEIRRHSSVWIVPPFGSLESPSEMELVEQLKPKLLLAELEQWGLTALDAGIPIDAQSFDLHLSLDLREYPGLLSL